MLFVPKKNFEIFDEDNYFEKMEEVQKELEPISNNGYFKSFDENEIYYEYYLVENSKASIVIVHGYSEFSKKYHELCYYFLNSGFNVFIYDHRGHGLSCREIDNIYINHVNNFNDYVLDLDQYITKIVEPNSPNVPIHIYSHSMGGAITALYLAGGTDKIEKAVLSSPMIYPFCPPLPRHVLRMLMVKECKKNGEDAKFKFCSEFNPDVKFEENKSDSSKARFQYNLDMRKANPRYQNSMSSNRWNYEILGVKKQIFKKCKKSTIKSELYIISASNDGVVKTKPQRKLAKQLGCKFTSIEGAKHSMCTTIKSKFSNYFDMLINFY